MAEDQKVQDLWDFDNPEITEQRLLKILSEAEQSGNVERFAEILTYIVRNHTLEHDFDEAYAMLDDVGFLLEDCSPQITARYLLELGRIYYMKRDERDKELAASLFEESWDIAYKNGGARLIADAVQMIAQVRFKEAKDFYRIALEHIKDSDDVTARVDILIELAHRYFRGKEFADAHKTLDKAELLIHVAELRDHVRYLLMRGRTLERRKWGRDSIVLGSDFKYKANKKEAKECYMMAWNLALQAGETGLALVAARRITYLIDEEDRLEWRLKAVEESYNGTSRMILHWRALFLNSIAHFYFDHEDFETAKQMFNKEIQTRRKKGDSERELKGKFFKIGQCWRKLGQPDKAFEIQQGLEKEEQKLGSTPSPVLIEEIGECLLDMGRQAEAQPHFAKAYAILSQDIWLMENETERLERLRELGQAVSS